MGGRGGEVKQKWMWGGGGVEVMTEWSCLPGGLHLKRVKFLVHFPALLLLVQLGLQVANEVKESRNEGGRLCLVLVSLKKKNKGARLVEWQTQKDKLLSGLTFWRSS